jgi:hypothetical protein
MPRKLSKCLTRGSAGWPESIARGLAWAVLCHGQGRDEPAETIPAGAGRLWRDEVMKRQLKRAVFLLLSGFAVWSAKHLVSSGPRVALDTNAEETAAAAATAPKARNHRLARPAGTASSGASLTPSAFVSNRNSGEALAQRMRSLERLEACFISQDCRFDQSTPLAYHTEVSGLIVRELRAVLELEQAAGMNTGDDAGADAGAGAGRLSAVAEGVARKFVRFPDDDVKEASLDLLAGAAPSTENLDAILAGLRESVSAPLYETGLEVLSRYVDVDGHERLDEFVLASIRSGGHFVSQEVARRSLPFIHADNIEAFAAVARELPPRSSTRRSLELNLREFRRLQRGG